MQSGTSEPLAHAGPPFPVSSHNHGCALATRQCRVAPSLSRSYTDPWSLVLLLPVMFALVRDLRTREIPDWIPLVIVAWACLATAAGLTRSLGSGLIAGSTARARTWCRGVLPRLAWRRRCQTVGGDRRCRGPLGPVVDPGLDGGYGRHIGPGSRPLVESGTFAYVPAIAAGVVVETFWPGGLARVLLR